MGREDDISSVLAETPFFASLSPEHRQLCASYASWATYNAGQFLLFAGTEADRCLVLASGKVDLEVTGDTGPVTVETLGPHEVIGWSWLVAPYRWGASALAAEGVAAVSLDAVALRSACEANVDLHYELMAAVCPLVGDRLLAAQEWLVAFYG